MFFEVFGNGVYSTIWLFVTIFTIFRLITINLFHSSNQLTMHFTIRWLFLLLVFTSQITCGQNNSIHDYIVNYTKKHPFNGTILVQKNDTVMYHNSFGIADRRFNIPCKNQTKYKVASITKAFTSVLILKLYDENQIELSKTIDNYLPDFKGEASCKVTIHQLLNHTSGMRQIDTISSLENAFSYGLGYLQEPHTSEQLFQLFECDSLVNIPGKKWVYNNYEYIILGKIIEQLYNKTYEEVLIDEILTPLNMENTGLLRQKEILKNLASTYFTDNEETLVNDLPVYIENWYAAGAMYSTAENILKFSNALFSGNLIRENSLKLMLTPGLNEYGYGVWIRGQDREKRMERYGNIMGANVVWMQFLNRNMTIILLSNTDKTDLGKFALSLEKQL